VTAPLQLGLRGGERLYVNGAVLRVDRKVRIELLNQATFLLESHVMQVEEAVTPLARVYFVVQGQLMSPSLAGSLQPAIAGLFDEAEALGAASPSELEEARRQIAAGRPFDALKLLRPLLARERSRMNATPSLEATDQEGSA
jgi:flagellar protein FlbT